MSEAATVAIADKVDRTKRIGAVFGVLIVLLGVLDVISTNLVLAAGGSELNPIVAWFMEVLDHWWHLPKLALHVLAGLLVYHVLRSRLAATCAIILIIFYVAVVQNNFLQLLVA
jgi:hypothetical protein